MTTEHPGAPPPPVYAADLHLHFEGCLFPSTLEKIAGRETAAALAWRPGGGFAQFLGCLKGQLGLLDNAKAFHLALDGFCAYLRRENLERCEFFFSPLIYDKVGFSARGALEALAARRDELPGRCAILFDTVRQFGPGAAERVVELALEWRARLPVAGFGMGGDESSFPAREFRPAFDAARAAGLGLTCHAGETGEAREIWRVIDELGVTRIGHGLAAAGDAALLKRMLADGIAVECAPGSNLALGLVKEFAAHPLHAFARAGIDLLPGADDPALFGAGSREAWARVAKVAGEARVREAVRKHAFG